MKHLDAARAAANPIYKFNSDAQGHVGADADKLSVGTGGTHSIAHLVKCPHGFDPNNCAECCPKCRADGARVEVARHELGHVPQQFDTDGGLRAIVATVKREEARGMLAFVLSKNPDRDAMVQRLNDRLAELGRIK